MSWKITDAENKRQRFIAEQMGGEFTMAELARRFGVSRKTADKWLDRYREEGPGGLGERPRVAHWHPQAIEAALVEQVLLLKAR